MRLLTRQEDTWLNNAFIRGKRYPNHGQEPVSASQCLTTKGLADQDGFVVLILTYDEGGHSSGWWRNSQYERCWHLSISARNDLIGEPELPTQAEIEAWGRVVFRDDLAKTWLEPPARKGDLYRPHGHAVTHIRLFLDENRQPFQPTGEVYRLVPFADGTSPEKVFR